MRHAFIGGTLVAVASGALGYFVVIRRDAFAAHALAHIGFPGATAAVLIGVPVTVGLSVFCVAGALAIGALGKEAAKREIATGSVLAAATALGCCSALLRPTMPTPSPTCCFGNLLAISVGQIRVFTVFTICMLTALAFIGRPLAFASLDAEVAEAKGVPVKALGVIFVVLLALVVTMASKSSEPCSCSPWS
jgi:zinc/manganese transport system permease protein